MNGLEFRIQQELDPRLALIPVVIMTAHGDAQIENKKIDLVFKSYIAFHGKYI